MPRIGTISTYEIEVDLVVEWKIDTFSTLSETYGAYYYSPNFIFGRETWDLQINPNGCSNRNSYGHVDLGLYKLNSGCSIKQSFSLLLTAKKEKYNEQHCMGDFSKYSLSHVCNRFILRSELTRRKSELMPKDVLTVVCIMKSSTPARSDTGKGHEENSENARVDAFTQTEEQEGNSGFAVYCTFDSDLDEDECYSDSDSGECCFKCSVCLNIVKRQKLLEEEFENQKENLEGAQSLCEDYKKMLLGGRHHDVILKVGNKELRAHRDILRARSRVFESMLDNDMKEKNSGIINVPDCDPNAMELFLSYVYCREIEALDPNNMLGLYYIADKYEIVELRRECCNFIKESLCLTNICSIFQLALKHSDSDLLEYATVYFAENMLDILQTVEWQSFLKDNSTVGNELLIKSIKLKNAQS